MAKVIRYKLCTVVNCGTEEAPIFEEVLNSVEIGWNEINEQIAQREAHNGEYVVEDTEEPEPDTTTTDDVLNALLGV